MVVKSWLTVVLASLGIATTGVLVVPSFSFPSNSAALKEEGMLTGQMMHGQMMHGQMMHGQMMHGQMMHQMQISNEFEFLSLMIPHHQEAIATAERVLQHSDRPEMRAFAQQIIEVQSAEIEQMQAWLREWYPNQRSTETYAPMMRDLAQLEGDELDQAFLSDMIMHHMGAVMMSQQLVNHGLGEHAPIRPFAQNIATTQRQEIRQMQAWLADWYGVAGMHSGHNGRWSGRQQNYW